MSDKQWIVTLTGHSITVQKCVTPVTVPPDAQFVSVGANLGNACDNLEQSIYGTMADPA